MCHKLFLIFSKILFQVCFPLINLYVGNGASRPQDAFRNAHITAC